MNSASTRRVVATTIAVASIAIAILNHFSNLQTIEQLLPASLTKYGYLMTIAGFVIALVLLRAESAERLQPRLRVEYDPSATKNPHGDREIHRLGIRNLLPVTTIDDVTVSIVASSQNHLQGFMPFLLRKEFGEPPVFSVFGDRPTYIELLEYTYGGDSRLSADRVERDLICAVGQRGAFMHDGEYTFEVEAVGRNVAKARARFHVRCEPSICNALGEVTARGRLIITTLAD
jgi:hypothetical protein